MEIIKFQFYGNNKIGTYYIMFNIIKFCEDKKNCNYAGYNKNYDGYNRLLITTRSVTSTNNPAVSCRMRYAEYIRKF